MMAFDVIDCYSYHNYIRHLGSLRSWQDVGRQVEIGQKCGKAARGMG